ncbi:histidine kinase [Streptomyces sp. CBMA29]|uniref:histidine kinase n=1 Tax=Streptomyces sp. CBMA29 TaxID=1896314 RepID=UPI002948B9C9|nr:histidine kinase [Streptomyces sp. CBMA29]MBD0736586.1 two-component sensor histidine kinase [Streptomyces sp. CBMA29]
MLTTIRRPPRDDVLIAAAGLTGGLVMWGFGLTTGSHHPEGNYSWLTLLPLGLMTACEAFRRTAPALTLPVGLAALALDSVFGSLLVTIVMFTDVVYACVLYGGRRPARAVPVAAVAVTVALTLVLGAVSRDPQSLVIGLLAALVLVAPSWTGLIVRQHRETADAATLRAEQTALLAELDRRQAVTGERSRMARELHDLVANHLSAIAIHSTAALSVDKREGPARDALGVIRENSVLGLAEMRRLIGLLRDPAEGPDSLEPAAAPSLDAADTLVEQARAAGAESGLRFTLRDERTRDAPPVPSPVGLAAYRILQESLTNALKHAAPGRVLVVLHQREDALAVVVSSGYAPTPGGTGTGPRAPGSGAGLIGMRERVALLGGEFQAGPDPDGRRWRVQALLPVEHPAAAAGSEPRNQPVSQPSSQPSNQPVSQPVSQPGTGQTRNSEGVA